MATGDTDVTICSDALVLLGAAAITSLTDGSDTADACNRLYPDLKNHLLTVYPWSWSLKKVQLSKDSTDPVNEWDNAFNFPADLIGSPIAVFDSSASGTRPRRYGWEIYGTQLFTNLDTIYIDYQATVTEANMPAYFVRFLRVALASEIAITVTDQATKADYFRAQAYGSPGESGRGGLLREAMNIDGRGQGTQIVEDYSLIQARY
jgi:hypothetical protein